MVVTAGFFKRTLKALANFSPGFALKPWGRKCLDRSFATLKELRGFAVSEQRRNSFRVASSRMNEILPGLQERNPGLELANAFSVTDQEFSDSRYRVVVLNSWVRSCEWPCLRLYQQFRESRLHLLYFWETE